MNDKINTSGASKACMGQRSMGLGLILPIFCG
jgi:hypothetical protein